AVPSTKPTARNNQGTISHLDSGLLRPHQDACACDDSIPGFASAPSRLVVSAKTYSFSNTSDRNFRPCRISGLRRGLREGFLYTPQMVVTDLLEQLADAGAADVVGLGQVGNRTPTPAVLPQRLAVHLHGRATQ